jgi:uncharacterized protein (TIGR03435 family)
LRAPFSAGIVVFAFAIALAQATEKPTFEVASVKPAASPGSYPGGRFSPRGGPGTQDPGRITWSNAQLMTILMTAYDVKLYQISGPAWLDTERYDIVAKVPEGATIEQVPAMWRNLLAERFGMVLHHESKEFQVDEVVVAKGGPKFKETTLDPNASPATERSGGLKFDGNGVPEMNGSGFMMTTLAGPAGPVGYMVARAQGLSLLLKILEDRLRHPVVDQTGLTGKYDFGVQFTPDLSEVRLPLGAAPGPPSADAGEPWPNLVAAVEQQLGLRLVPSKAKLDIVVVDKAEKAPTDN